MFHTDPSRLYETLSPEWGLVPKNFGGTARAGKLLSGEWRPDLCARLGNPSRPKQRVLILLRVFPFHGKRLEPNASEDVVGGLAPNPQSMSLRGWGNFALGFPELESWLGYAVVPGYALPGTWPAPVRGRKSSLTILD